MDVDIFYTDELPLGRKIKLAENVVKVLRKMKCPSPLQAHQIQGNDYEAIFPCVQWLVRKVLENRKRMGDYVRQYSEMMFGKEYYVPEAGAGSGAATQGSAAPAAGVSDFLGEVLHRYRAQRQFRRNARAWQATLTREARVQSCLLEYGEKVAGKAHFVEEDDTAGGAGGRGRRGSAGAATEFDRKFAKMQKEAAEEEAARLKEAAELEASMMGQMAAAGAGAASGQAAGALVGMQGDSIRSAAAEYARQAEETRREAESGELVAGTRMGKAQAHKRQVAALQRLAAAGEAKSKTAKAQLGALEAKYAALQRALERTREHNARVLAKTAEVEALAAKSEHQAELQRLMSLVGLNESLKGQEGTFKANCKRQLGSLQATLAEVRKEGDDEESARLREIEEVYADVAGKYSKFRSFLSAKNQEISRLSRLIDDVPTRSELIQYERRFIELYDEVALKLEETRKYYATYNMLESTRNYLQKEEKLISSINDKFATEMRSRSSKSAFVKGCVKVVEGLRQNLERSNNKLLQAQEHRDDAKAAQQRAIDKQRAYYQCVKEFQEACDRNEQLTAKLEALKAGRAG